MRLCGIASKADDPWVSKQTILKRIKADDLRAKEDDPGLKQRSLVKADVGPTIFLGESRRSLSHSRRSRTKVDHSRGRNPTISHNFKSNRSLGQSERPKGMKVDDPKYYF